MNEISEIYNLIKNDNSKSTFENNKELFLSFYRNDYHLMYSDYKLMDIYKYILSLDLDEYDEDFPYFKSKIIQDINKYEQYITQSPYFGDAKIDEEYVNKLFTFINDFEEIESYSKNAILSKLQGKESFIRDYTGSMIIILNKSFFSLSKDTINKMISYIKNNDYIKTICSNTSKNQLLDKDYIFQYCSRYLFTSSFINIDNFDDDILLNSLKNKQITNKEVFKRIIENLNDEHFKIVFNNDLSLFLDSLEPFDDSFKIQMFNKIFNRLNKELSNNNITLLNFIMHDKRIYEYLSEDTINDLINLISQNYFGDFNDEEILFLCDRCDDLEFILNVKENIKFSSWKEETKAKIIEKFSDINLIGFSQEEAIQVLDAQFKGQDIPYYNFFEVIKRLIRTYLQDENIPIYFGKNDSINGCALNYDNGSYAIFINADRVLAFKNTNDYEKNPESMHILNTLYHEARHIKQNKWLTNNEMDSGVDIYFKERLLSSLLADYYDKNYHLYSMEIDARFAGNIELANLLEKHFPYLTNCINHYKKQAKKEEENLKKCNNKRIFELSEIIDIDSAIDKLVSLCPSLIKDNIYLQKIYNADGTRKISNTASKFKPIKEEVKKEEIKQEEIQLIEPIVNKAILPVDEEQLKTL